MEHSYVYISATYSRTVMILKVLSFYGNEVDYYGKGIVPIDYIVKDKEIFFKSWSKLSYSLANDMRITKLNNSDTVRLLFTFEFVMETRGKIIRATTRNTWDIENASANPKIVAEKQSIINRNQF